MKHPRTGEQKLKLSALQEAVLHWLRRELRRRAPLADAHGIPYPELAQALGVDRGELSACLRRLVRKRLVVASLPRGSWMRYVTLTDKAQASPQQNPPGDRKKHRNRGDGRERRLLLSRGKTKSRRRKGWTHPTEMDI